MRVLGIETSCDETGVAVYDAAHGLLAHAVHSQVDIHAEFGGVVPELASRDHVRRLPRLVRRVLAASDSRPGDIGGVAYTAGPGLVGALLVGTAFGRSLARAWGVPALGVHHMEGHLLAPMLEPDPPAFPFLALLVSGGHTQLVGVEAVGSYEAPGGSVAHAAGEACAFEKPSSSMGGSAPGPEGSFWAADGAGGAAAVREGGAVREGEAGAASADGCPAIGATGSPASAAAASPSSSAMMSPSLTRSPTSTFRLTMRPPPGDGTSMAALSVSSVISGSLAATSSPAETATSTTSTSVNSPKPGTRT